MTEHRLGAAAMPSTPRPAPPELSGLILVEFCMSTYIARTIAVALLAFVAASPTYATDAPAALLAQAKVTESEARQVALARVPSGTVESAELEREHGLLIWSIDVRVPKSRNITEVQVDAHTGKIVSLKIETPADQAKEAAADKASSR